MAKRDTIRSELLDVYMGYAECLENVSAGLMDVQRQMIDLLRAQAMKLTG